MWAPVAGKYGKTRDGRKVGPMEHNDAKGYPWRIPTGSDPDHRYINWRADGSNAVFGSRLDPAGPEFDLVAEWVDDGPVRTVTRQEIASGEWHRADSERSILLYTLKQDGWRKGEPAMVNDLMVRIENAPHSDHDLGPIADQILSTLTGVAALELLTVDDVERVILETEPSQLSDRGDQVWARRMATALAARVLAQLAEALRNG